MCAGTGSPFEDTSRREIRDSECFALRAPHLRVSVGLVISSTLLPEELCVNPCKLQGIARSPNCQAGKPQAAPVLLVLAAAVAAESVLSTADGVDGWGVQVAQSYYEDAARKGGDLGWKRRQEVSRASH